MKLLRMADVIEKTGLSRSTILRREKAGTFPAPKAVSEGVVAWLESEIDEWIKALPTKANEGVS